MSKAAKRAANEAAQATSQTEAQATSQAEPTPAPVMQVLKPITEEPEREPQKPASIAEIKRKAMELHYLSEQHDRLLIQLESIQQFAAEVGENATLKLTSDGVHAFTSNDPAAVSKMIDICLANLKVRIDDVEKKLTA